MEKLGLMNWARLSLIFGRKVYEQSTLDTFLHKYDEVILKWRVNLKTVLSQLTYTMLLLT